MKILFYIPTLQHGGVEKLFVTLANTLNVKCSSIIIVVNSLNGAVYKSELDSNIKLVNIDSNRAFKSLFKLRNVIAKEKPNVVLAGMAHLYLSLAILKFLGLIRSKIFGLEGSIIAERSDKWYIKISYYLFLRKMDGVICQTEYMRECMEGIFPKYKSFKTIYNPFDFNKILEWRNSIDEKVGDYYSQIGSDTFKVVVCGRLVPVKRIELLVEAMRILIDRNIKIHCTILGDGPERYKIESLVARYSLNKHITMWGFTSNPYIHYNNSSLYIMTSLTEGFGNVVIEALACNLPVLSVPVRGGVPEILEKFPGCIQLDKPEPILIAESIINYSVCKNRKLDLRNINIFDSVNIANQYMEFLRS